MKIAKKRLISILLAVCLVIGIMPVSGLAAKSSSFDAVGGKVTYEIMDDGTVTITGCDTSVTAIEIPDTLEGLPVTKIADYAFNTDNYSHAHEALTSVKLPSTLEEIGQSAFGGCKNLTDVNFADCVSLTTIKEYAFEITGFTSVTLPASVSEIGWAAFAACPQLMEADFTACTNLEVVEDSLFGENSQLVSVELPESVKIINREAFAFCTSLSEIDLSGCRNLTEIGEKAFYGDTALTDLKLPAGLKSVGKEAFESCTSLADLDLSVCTSLTEIGELAFRQIPVTSISFPASLEVIGRGAFDECEQLSNVTWPENSQLRVLSGFSRCTALPVSVYNEGVSLPKVTVIGEEAFRNNYFESVTIPENIREIGNSAFTGDGEDYTSQLKSLTILPGVETIGEYAFTGCPIEGTLNIPKSVSEIGSEAFSGTDITGVNLAFGVETIGEGAFTSCEGLEGTTIIVPESVNLVGREAFECIAPDKPLTVEFRNRDIMLQEALYDGQVSVGEKQYYTAFSDSYEASNIIIRAYEKDSNGDTSMMKLLYDALVNDPDRDPEHIYQFEAISDETCTVSGMIPDNAKIRLYVNGREVPVQIKDGSFSVLVDKGATVEAEVSRDAYYEKHFIKTDIGADWDLGEITFTEKEKIPSNRLMLVDFQNVTVSSFEKLSMTLAEGSTVLNEGSDYTLQYPYIALAQNVTADTLTLSIDADGISCTGASVTADRSSGVFQVSLTPWGKAGITAESEFAGDNNILVFSGDGAMVCHGTITSNGLFLTDALKAGTYTVAAFNANDSFSTVSSIDGLKAMGLEAGGDYAKKSVQITDDNQAEITLNVPILKTNVSDVLNQDKCNVIASQNKIIAGQSLRTRVYYSFADGKTGTVTVALPNGVKPDIIYTQDEVLKQGTDYTLENDILTIPVKKSEGLLYMRLIFTKPGWQSVSVSGTVKNVTAPVGSTTVQVQGLCLEPESQILTERTGNVANITAAPDSEVELRLDGETVASGTTNKSGTLRLTYDLPEDILSGQQFRLEAVCGGERSETTVSYVIKESGLETWYFYWNDNKEFLFNVSDQDIKTSYYTEVYVGEYLYFAATFLAETEPTDVITYVGMTNGDVEYVPMSLVKTEKVTTPGKEQNRYTFSGKMKATTRVAEDFALDWNDDSEYFTYDVSTAAQIEKKAAKVTAERRELIAEARDAFEDKLKGIVPEIEDASAYIFGAKYRVSQTDWFLGLSESEQAAAYNLEKAIDRAISGLSKSYSLKKDLTEYSGWDEVYAEIGITQSKNTRTADELREDGFTVCENGSTFTAYKDDTEETQTETAPLSALGRAGGGVSGVSGGFTFIDENGNQVDFEAGALDNINQSIRNDNFSDLTDAYDDFANAVKSNPSCGTLEAGVLDGVSGSLQVVNTINAIDGVRQDAESMVDFTVRASEMQGYVDELKLFENRYADKPLCSNAIMRERFTAQSLQLLLDNEAFRFGANSIANSILIVGGVVDKTGASDIISFVWDKATNVVGARRAAQIQSLLETLDKQTRERKQRCEKTDMADIMRRTRKKAHKKGLVDPSGMVYEAVESNTLAGVTATVWYADDAEGTNAKIWDADSYDQINPQITDESGRYAWDVTTGWWQVRFEKDGYETAYTEWMEVPPPRLGLKTAMISKALPEVVSAKAYPDYIEVMFSQYMDTTKKITLPEGMTGTWQSVDSGFSKVLHITKKDGFKKGSTISFTINGAENYAGKALASYQSEELTVSARPAEIIVNYESVISVKAGVTRELTVRVKDADGNYMPGVILEAVIGNTDIAGLADSSAITDETGKSVFGMNTELPGLTDITFRVEGTSLAKILSLDITVDENRPLRPTAQIGTTVYTADSPKENYITVDKGEQLIISAEEDVTIYYTTDDTCPCQNSESRKVYTGPITITENTKYRITAYRDGMDYSERLNITVTVDDTHKHSYGSEWKMDESSHWHECSCGAVSDKSGHDWKVENAKDATATVSGYTGDKICQVCGYTVKGTEIPATGTTTPVKPGDGDSTNSGNGTDADSIKPGNGTNTDATKPNETMTDSTKLGGTTADATKPENGTVTDLTNSNGDSNKNADGLQTGDNSNLWMWFVALFISGGAGVTIYSRKKKYVK